MGLDTTHDAWSGAYSSFHRFRVAIAKAARIELDSMEGFGGPVPWAALPPDPLHALLNHSDSGGDIKPLDCALIADRLEEIRDSEYFHDDAAGDHATTRKRIDQFVAGCRACAEAGEPMEFF